MVEAKLRVVYGDTDQMGVVYYANYLRYFEFGRSEYIRAQGRSYRDVEKEGARLPVVEASGARPFSSATRSSGKATPRCSAPATRSTRSWAPTAGPFASLPCCSTCWRPAPRRPHL